MNFFFYTGGRPLLFFFLATRFAVLNITGCCLFVCFFFAFSCHVRLRLGCVVFLLPFFYYFLREKGLLDFYDGGRSRQDDVYTADVAFFLFSNSNGFI